MEYQFDYATFCKTFNVKDDKAIDSLRLTHTQDINFKLQRQNIKKKKDIEAFQIVFKKISLPI